MTIRLQNYHHLIAMQDQAALVVALIALGILLGYAALNWLPPRVQNAARYFYLGWMMSAFIGTFIAIVVKG